MQKYVIFHFCQEANEKNVGFLRKGFFQCGIYVLLYLV